MPTITIKNIPQDLYEQLKLSASAHHRSINSELIHCLEMSLMPARLSAEEIAAAAQRLRSQVKTDLVDVDEMNEAKRAGRQ